MDPKKVFYEAQKLRVRFVRMIESLERLTGARPGPKLTVNFRGFEGLENTVRRAARRLSLALTAGAALLGAGITAASNNVAAWVPIVLGVTGGLLTLGLVVDLARRQNRS
jgi:hypothetical protein